MARPLRTRLPYLARLAAAGAGGALAVGGFAPFYGYPLSLLGLALLFALWRGAPPGRAALLGFAWGLGFFGVGVSWVYVSLTEFGGMPAWMGMAGVALFCALLAAFPALVGWVRARYCAQAPDWLALPALWALAEWLRGWLFTGFPWLQLGYSQVPASPLAAYAPVFGILGVGVAASVTAALGVHLAAGPRRLRAAFGLALVWVVAIGLGRVEWTRPSGPPLRVALLQGDVAQTMKWEPGQVRASLERYLALAQGTAAPLIILPETALPVFWRDLPADYRQAFAALAQARGGDVIAGVVSGDPDGAYYNSVVSLGAGPVQKYSKHHLVPFGEYVPPGFAWIVHWLRIPLSAFTPGPARQAPIAAAGQKLAMNICYEDAFGREVIRQLPAATVLVNVSNDAWFGHSLAPWQHAQMSQARALETGRMALRATNTGVTAVIGRHGEMRAHLPEFTRGVLEAQLQGYAGETPYVRWGDGAALVLACAMLGLACFRRRL